MGRFVAGAIGVFVVAFIGWSFLATDALKAGDRYEITTKSGKTYTYRDLFFSRIYVQSNGQLGGNFLTSNYVGEDTWSQFGVNTERGVLQVPREFNNVSDISISTMRRSTSGGHTQDNAIDESPSPASNQPLKRKAAPPPGEYLQFEFHFRNGDTVTGTRPISWGDYIEATSKRGTEKILLTEIVKVKRRWE